jgi:peptidoglycan/xylan/chitin deacetylase (PgdA/CDA1 family)
MEKGKGKLKKKAIYLITGILMISGAIGFAVQENRTRTQAVINQQVVLLAQKEAEDKDKLEEEKRLEEQKKLEEQKRLEEQKKLEEEKKLEEQRKLEEAEKHKQAIKGIGKSDRIPVLMYHSIDYEKGNELRIPKEKFHDQMKYLKDSGFNPIDLDELYSHIALGSKLPEKPIVITLDDGYVDNYTNAFPVLKEFGFKAVVFMITGSMDTSGSYITSEQIKEMDKNSMRIEGHTVTHPQLDTLSYSKQLSELRDSKASLEKVLGRDVKYFAYPYGKFNNDTLKAVEEAGYKLAFSTKGGLAVISNGVYKLHRIYVSEKYSLKQFQQLVNMK